MTVQEKIEPEVMDYASNSMRSVTCSSDNYESTKWYFNNGDLPSNVENSPSQKHIIIIKKMKDHNIGLYECHGYYRTHTGSMAPFAAFALLRKSKKAHTSQTL